MNASSLRRRILREWRGLDERPGPKGRVRQVGDGVHEALHSLGLDSRLTEEQIARAWPAVVGPLNATHSRPVQFRRGTLMVHVLQPTVRMSLEMHRSIILERLQQQLGSSLVRDVRFVLG